MLRFGYIYIYNFIPINIHIHICTIQAFMIYTVRLSELLSQRNQASVLEDSNRWNPNRFSGFILPEYVIPYLAKSCRNPKTL
jgi:hypothetical protein